MKVIEVPGAGEAVAEAFGVSQRVRTELVGTVSVGEYLLVHAGCAVEKVDAASAGESLELLAQVLAAGEERRDGND